MNMDELLEKNCELPGVSLKKGPNSMDLCLNLKDGHGKMIFYSLFPGLSLAYIKICSPIWPVVNPGEMHGQLLLNYCMNGRCELFLDNNSFIYIEQGDFSLSSHAAQDQFVYPRKTYEGIEFYFDMEHWKKHPDFLQENFELPIPKLQEIYCCEDRTYVSRADTEMEQVLKKLWDLHKNPSVFHMRLFSLELLYLLLDQKKMPQPKTCSFYTDVQVKIAKAAEKIITADLSRHYPVRELAAQFSTSETSLKNYFRGVYGQNISLYLRELRMNTAAKLLSETRTPVSEISAQVGYTNQGKFAAVFKGQYKYSPLEYRRLKILEALRN